MRPQVWLVALAFACASAADARPGRGGPAAGRAEREAEDGPGGDPAVPLAAGDDAPLAPAPDAPAPAPPPDQATAEPRVRELRLSAPPHPIPDGAPHAIVATTGAPKLVFVFLHGWRGCARELAFDGPVACREGEPPRPGWGLLGRFEAAERDAMFVVAQLAWRARSGDPGRFAEEGYAARWLDEVGAPPAAPVVLLAHSAGFETARAIARHGGLEDRLVGVVLFDALYAGTEAFATWVAGAPRRRLVSFATRTGRPARQQRRLRRLTHRAGLNVASALDAVADAQVITLRATTGHADVPRQALTEVVVALSDAWDAP